MQLSEPAKDLFWLALLITRDKTKNMRTGVKQEVAQSYATRRLTNRVVIIKAHQTNPVIAMIAQPNCSTIEENRPAMPPTSHALKNVIAASRLAHRT